MLKRVSRSPLQAEHSEAIRKARGFTMPGKQRTGTRTAANKAARLPARPGRHESPANTPQTPRTGGAGRTPDNGEKADAQRATARSGIQKKIYIHHAKQAQFEAPAKVRRNPTPDGNGRRTWKRGGESDSEPPPQVRAILSASASARFGADSGAAGGRPGNGRGEQMRFRMFSYPRLAQSKDARKTRARKRTLWRRNLVYM